MTGSRYGTEKSVLVVSPDETDYRSLRGIAPLSAWIVFRAHNPLEATQILSETRVDVVIADSRCWKSLLAPMWKLEFPLIVADRLADERLWAEVLNLGAYDLIAKPFDAKVLLHVLSSACLRESQSLELLSRKVHGCSEDQPVCFESIALVHP